MAGLLDEVSKLWLNLGRTGEAESGAKLCGGFAVAEKTEGAQVVQIALTAAFGYRADVVGVPETATGCYGFHSVEMQAGCPRWAAGSLESVVGGDGVDLADRADAVVASKDLVAEVAGVCAETPLMDAVVAAEGAAALCEDFEVAPAA